MRCFPVPALVAKSFLPWAELIQTLAGSTINCFESSFEACLHVHGSNLVTKLLKGAMTPIQAKQAGFCSKSSIQRCLTVLPMRWCELGIILQLKASGFRASSQRVLSRQGSIWRLTARGDGTDEKNAGVMRNARATTFERSLLPPAVSKRRSRNVLSDCSRSGVGIATGKVRPRASTLLQYLDVKSGR